MSQNPEANWYENDEDESIGYSFKEYDVTSTPNDFNTKTIIDFIESGLFKIPGFQRNYVWDKKRASKLIESLIIGLPIPQVFLYEESRNNYLVIDGQQRLLTIYFFSKKRFPKKEKRFELRQIFDENGKFDDTVLNDDEYFEDFKLYLKEPSQVQENKLHGLTYDNLDDFKSTFDLRTIRNIMIKQNFPNDDSAMFEIFYRLNSGGIVLKPQEIRTSLYHSSFYNRLYKLNLDELWRELLDKSEPDLHMKDIEVLLRGFALLIDEKNYAPSMARFLNEFSKKSRSFSSDFLSYSILLFKEFCKEALTYGKNVFNGKNGKFSITVFESIFVALCSNAFNNKNLTIGKTTREKIKQLKDNADFLVSTQNSTTSKKNVETRLKKAKEILS